jgi:predicted permease
MMFTTVKELVARVLASSRSGDLDRDFAQELDSHLAMLVEDHLRRGMAPEQARRAALMRMGAPASLMEQHRTVRGLPAVGGMLQDVRFACRLLARDRWFAAAAMVTLALGIGLNAIGFTIVNAAFLRGLPFADANRLLVLGWREAGGLSYRFSLAELQDLRAGSHTFTGLAGFANAAINISDERALPEEARGTWVTANSFGVLRQLPLVGRDFGPHDDRIGADPVAILSYRVWKNRYGADPAVLGKTLRLNGQPATIIGVMPDGMNFPNNTEVWAPFIPSEMQRQRGTPSLNVFGRLRDGVARAQAEAELNGIARQLATAYPEANTAAAAVFLETFTERYVGGPARTMFLTLMGAVSLVLLIACANVANLILSRAPDRARELAVRIALGATRWRVVRQLLIESIVLGCIGGSTGLLLADTGIRMVAAAVQDPDKPYWINFTVDYVVFGYVAAVCVLTGTLFGLAPALHVSKTDVNHVLKEGGRATAVSRRARWFSGTMVVAQLALTIVLLVGAGLMVRSFINLYNLDTGFRTENLMTLRMQLPAFKYPNPDARRAFYERLEPRVAAIPGVERVAITTVVPPFAAGQRPIEIEGRAAPTPDRRLPNVSTVTISPEFFETIGVTLVRGRSFQPSDGAPGAEAIIINEQVAANFFRAEDPIGKRVRFPALGRAPGPTASPWLTIVGISPIVRHGMPRPKGGGGSNEVVYVPSRQDPPASASLLVRSLLPPASVMEAVRYTVQSIDRDQPVFAIQTLDQMLAQDRWPFRVFGALFGSLGLIALVLSSVGLYAVMAYVVSQRTQEIGVRMALGGDERRMYWLILRRGLAQLGIGLTLGLAGAVAVSQVMRTLLVEITPTDPITYVTITVVLTAVAIVACLIPARRATRVDPVVALRAE